MFQLGDVLSLSRELQQFPSPVHTWWGLKCLSDWRRDGSRYALRVGVNVKGGVGDPRIKQDRDSPTIVEREHMYKIQHEQSSGFSLPPDV